MSKISKNIDIHLKILKSQKFELKKKINLFSKLIISSFNKGGKLLIVGNGGSAADSQHLATELTVRMSKNRTALPAMALTTDTSAITAISNDYNYSKVFSRQVEALGNEEIIINLASSLCREYKIKNLCLAGGVALNCVVPGSFLLS